MRVLITGASGWIGTALTTELVAAGHEVVGLARSDASAAKITALGGTAVRGDMADHDLIVAEAERADAVAHLAFTLDFAEFEETVDNEVALVGRIGKVYAGTGKAFVAASGTRSCSAESPPRRTTSTRRARPARGPVRRPRSWPSPTAASARRSSACRARSTARATATV